MRGLYNLFVNDLAGPATIDLLADDIVVVLVSDLYRFDQEDKYLSDLGLSELSGTGYERKTLSGKSLLDGVFDANDVLWNLLDAGTVNGIILAKDTGDDHTSPLLAYTDEGQLPRTSVGTPLSLRWQEAGILEGLDDPESADVLTPRVIVRAGHLVASSRRFVVVGRRHDPRTRRVVLLLDEVARIVTSRTSLVVDERWDMDLLNPTILVTDEAWDMEIEDSEAELIDETWDALYGAPELSLVDETWDG